jgi:hypothetical protein
MYKNKTKSPPTLSSAGNVKINVSKIILILFNYLKILNNCITFNPLISEIDDTPVILSFYSNPIPIIANMATPRLKMFQPNLKYLFPNPIIFIIASRRNIKETT